MVSEYKNTRSSRVSSSQESILASIESSSSIEHTRYSNEQLEFGQNFSNYLFLLFFSNLQEQFIKCISHIDVQKNLARVVRVRVRVVRVVRVFRVVRAQKLLLVHHRVARARRTSNTRSSRVSSTRITREYRVEYIYSLRFDDKYNILYQLIIIYHGNFSNKQ